MGLLSFLRISYQPAVYMSALEECSGDDKLMMTTPDEVPTTPEALKLEHSILPLPSSLYNHPQPLPRTSIHETDVTDEETKTMEFYVELWKGLIRDLFYWSTMSQLLASTFRSTAELEGIVKYCVEALMFTSVPGWLLSMFLFLFYSHPDKQRIFALNMRSRHFISFIADAPFASWFLSFIGFAFQGLVAAFGPDSTNYVIVLFMALFACGVMLRRKLREEEAERRDEFARIGGRLV